MTDDHKLLREKVEQCFGEPIINFDACERLADAVMKATHQTISQQTLRRFFNVIKSKTRASANTLNLLSRYTGYRDIQDFLQQQKRGKRNPDINLTTLQSIFSRSNEYVDNWILWHEQVIALFAEIVLTNEVAFDEFVVRMHEDPGAMQYVIATFQMWDNLSKDWYMRGLRLFCRDSKESHHRMYLATKEFLACLLADKLDKSAPYITTIKEKLPAFKKQYGDTFLPLEGAIYAELIIDAHYHNHPDEMNEYFRQAQRILDRNYRKNEAASDYDNRESWEGFPITLCNKLNCYGLYELTEKVISRYEIIENKNRQWWRTEKALIDTIRATAYFQTKKRILAKNIYDTINIDHLNFDWKNTITVQYLLLKLGFTPKKATIQRKKIKQQIEQIVAQTGMIIFKKHIPKFEE